MQELKWESLENVGTKMCFSPGKNMLVPHVLESSLYHIILYIIKVGLRCRSCATWFHQIVEILINFQILRIDIYIFFWINMTNQVIKESSI